MLITNGVITRNIAAGRLPEYLAKGYKEVEEPEEVEEPAAKKTRKKQN